jgi:hypothetical protein
MRTIVCPYYDTDKKAHITCEDGILHFSSREEKRKYMTCYCGKHDGYLKCEKAARLQKIYDTADGYRELQERLQENKMYSMQREMNKIEKQKNDLLKKLEAKDDKNGATKGK